MRKARFPWLTLLLLSFVLIAVFEPDIKSGNWIQAGIKLAIIGGVMAGIVSFVVYVRKKG